MSEHEFITSNTNNDKLEFRQIVLQHFKKILDLSLNLNKIDLKKRIIIYNSSVKTFSEVLLPYFDEEMDKSYKDYIKQMQSLREQFVFNSIIRNSKTYYVLSKRIHSELFINLNLLMKRRDYIKGVDYEEESD